MSNFFQTPPDNSWTSHPILISTADVFKSPGSVQSNTSEGGWANTSWFTQRPAFPQFSRGFEFNSRRIATYKHVLRQLYFFVPVFFISLSNLCIQPLSRGGWSYGQPLHLWKICRYKFNCSSAENVSKLSFFWPGGQGVLCGVVWKTPYSNK